MSDDLTKLRAELREFVAERDWEKFHDPKNLSMLLASEIGELIAELRWVANSEADAKVGESVRRQRITEEVGDIAIAILLLCERIGVDFVQTARAKLELNRARYPAEAVRGKPDRPTTP